MVRRLWGLSSFIVIVLCGAWAPPAFAIAGSGISYQGRIIKPDATAENDSSVQFKIQVLSPTSNCVMYEETQTVDMSSGEGSFALTLNGSSSTRTDAATYSLDRIFSNTLPFSFTTPACSYSPAVSDGRVLSVSFKDSTMASFEAMPVQDLNYVPMALQAKAVAGFDATSLVRVQESNGTLDAVSPLNNAEYTELLALIGGTSAQYTKAGQLNGTAIPSMTSGQVLGWNGTAWVSSDPLSALPSFAKTPLPICGANTFLKDDGAGNLTCVGVAGASGGTVTSITAGTGLNGGAITSTGTISIAAGGVTNTELASGAVQSGNIQDGSVTTSKLASNVNVVTSGSISTTSNVTAANVSANAFSGQSLNVFETSNNYAVTIKASASLGANYTLTLPTANGTNGQVLTTTSAGVLSWTTISGTTPGGSAGGDLSGTYPNPQVAKLQGAAVATTTPGSGQSMIYNGSAWAPGFVSFANIKSSGNLAQFPTTCTASQTLTYSSGLDTFVCTDITADATKFTGIVPVANGGTGSDNGSIAGTGALTFAAGGTNQNIVLNPSGSAYTLLNGKVGVGSAAPANSLTISGTGSQNLQVVTTDAAAGSSQAGIIYTTPSGAALTGMTAVTGRMLNSSLPGEFIFSNRAGAVVFSADSAYTRKDLYVATNGNIGIGSASPSASLNIKAGTATAGSAPIKLTSGVNLTTPEAGAIEYDGTNLYYTNSSNARQTIATSSGTSSFSNVTTISDSGGDINLSPKSTTGAVVVNSGTPSTSSATGALQVTGGVGVTGAINVGGGITAGANVVTTGGMRAAQGAPNSADSSTTGYAFGSDGDTGLFSPGPLTSANGIVAVYSNNTEVARFGGGKVGIGTTSLTSPLTIATTAAATNGNFYGINMNYTVAPSGPSTAGIDAAIFSTHYTATDDLTAGGIYGAQGYAFHDSTATINAATGGYGQVTNSSTGTITSALGQAGYIFNTSTGTITTAMGLKGQVANSTGATIGNSYELYLTTSNTGTISNQFGVYQSQASSRNFFAGNIGVGVATPRSKLNIYSTGQTTANIDTSADMSNMLVSQSSNIANGDGGGLVLGTRTVGSSTDGLFAAIKALLTSGANNSVGDLAFSTRTTSTDSTLTEKMRIMGNGNVGIGTINPTATLHLKAGSATAGTAPLKLISGTNLATPEAGAVEFDGTNLYYTNSSNARQTIATTSGTSSFSGVTTVSNSSGDITLSPKSSTGGVAIDSGTSSTSSSTGALKVTGGEGVSGDIYAGASINAGSTMSAATSMTTPQIYGSSSPSGTLKLDGTSDSTKGYLLLNSAGGNVAIGTTTPTANLTVKSSSPQGPSLSVDQSIFKVTSNYGTPPVEMRFGASSAATVNPWIQSQRSNNDGTAWPLLLNPLGGNIGIGTTTPGYPLQVNGMTSDQFAVAENVSGRKISLSATSVNQEVKTSAGNLNLKPATGIASIYGAGVAGTLQLLDSSAAINSVITGSGVSYLMGGNIGIGTTAPVSLLDVMGGDLYVRSPYPGTGVTPASRKAFFETINSAGSRVAGAGMQVNYTRMLDTDYRSDLAFYTSLDDTPAEVMRITNDGKVGIGTTVPGTALDVNGTIRSTVSNGVQFSRPNNWFTISDQSGYSALSWFNYFDGTNWKSSHATVKPSQIVASDSGISFSTSQTVGVGSTISDMVARLFVANNGNVGIGTAAPQALLHVQNTGSNPSATAFQVNPALNGSETSWTVAINPLRNSDHGLLVEGGANINQMPLAVTNFSGTNLFAVHGDGSVGIGSTVPAATLDVAGSVHAQSFKFTGNDYSSSWSTDASWAGAWVTLINPGTVSSGTWIFTARWDHGGGGAPFVVASSFNFVIINTNGNGADAAFTPPTSMHTGGGASPWQFRSIAGSTSYTGLQIYIPWSTAGSLALTGHRISD